MRIKEITSQHRRDINVIFECEHCGYEYPGGGYDDTNFHVNVLPQMKCPECGKTAGSDYKPRVTKYPDGMSV